MTQMLGFTKVRADAVVISVVSGTSAIQNIDMKSDLNEIWAA